MYAFFQEGVSLVDTKLVSLYFIVYLFYVSKKKITEASGLIRNS